MRPRCAGAGARWTSLPPSAGPSRVVPQVGAADAQHVAGGEPARAVEADAVDVRPVRRADVLDPDAVAAWLDARVLRRREFVLVKLDVVRVAAAERERRGVEL